MPLRTMVPLQFSTKRGQTPRVSATLNSKVSQTNGLDASCEVDVVGGQQEVALGKLV